MFDPEADLTAIWRVLSNDKPLLDLLGYTSGSKTNYIWKGDQAPQATGKRLCFYHAPSRQSHNDLCSIEVIQFDAHVPLMNAVDARNIQKRVAELIKKHEFNGHKLYFMGQLPLPSATGYTCVATRYRYPIVV
jgi:hypothetical protein